MQTDCPSFNVGWSVFLLFALYLVFLGVIGKQGAWLSTGCVMTSDVSPVVTFKCNHLTNFAVAEVGCIFSGICIQQQTCLLDLKHYFCMKKVRMTVQA